MLSLSLFCSSQTISVALYDRRKLKKFLYKKINNTGIESIFKLIKNCFEGENIKGLSNIFFSNGPGSFTALRTIRSIVEALSLSTNAKVFSVSSFVPLLLSRKDYSPNFIVCLKSLKGKSFFQLYKKKGKVFSKESIVFLDNLKEVEKFYLANAKKIKELSLITNDKKDLEILNKKIKNVFFYPLSAKKIAEVCFLGYGSRNLDIIYHTSYYEKY